MIVQHNPITAQTPCQCQQLARPTGMGAVSLPSISLPSLGSIDWGDWKTWAIAGLGAWLIYALFFRKRDRERRTARRKDYAKARAAYDREIARIRGQYA